MLTNDFNGGVVNLCTYIDKNYNIEIKKVQILVVLIKYTSNPCFFFLSFPFNRKI